MSRLHGWWYTLRSLARRDEADREMADEISFHVEHQTRKYEARGMASDEARRRALREFGGRTRWREEARTARGSGVLDAVEQDFRQTLRGLRRDPAFAVMAVATLAVAVGANAAMFGIIDRLLLRGPAHVSAPDQLARLYVTQTLPNSRVATSGWQPYVLYTNARDKTSAFSAVASYAPARLRTGSGVDARFLTVTYATSDLFALTGVRPALGRFYTADEDRPPIGQEVVVIGYRFWQREYSGDPAIIGKSVRLGDREFRVVGVTPRGFTGVELAPVDAWIPMSVRASGLGAQADWTTDWRGGIASIVGRLAVPKPVAEAQLTAMFRLAYSGPLASMRKASVSLRPIADNMEGVEPPEIGVARLLAGVALVMLLVAAANTTNLVLARAIRRRRELSVRVALGSGRWRLVRLMVLESVTISLFGGLVGIVLANTGGAIIRRTLLPDVAWSELPIDVRVLLWTAAVTFVVGVVVGLVPALRVSGGDVASALRAGRTGGGSAGDSHGVTRTSLQVVQLALSLVLLFTAGLFVRSLRDIQKLDLGYDRGQVLAVDVEFPRPDSAAGDSDAARLAAQGRYRDLQTRFARVPGVSSTSIAYGSPLSSVEILRIRVPGHDSLPQPKGAVVTAVSPGYFETVGTKIVRGRAFSAGEGAGTEAVVIINQAMADAIWPGEDPVGRCVVVVGMRGDACARVVGVARDVHHISLKEPATPQCYLPWGQDPRLVDGSVLLVRVGDDSKHVVAALTAVLRAAVPGIRSAEIKTYEQLLDPQVRPWRVGATLFGLFGVIVVAVAAIGLFSIVSYLVAQRTHELGVRIALGARRGQVLRLILGRGLRAAVAGAVLGSAAALAIGPRVQPLLFDNRARDPLLLAAVATVLLVVATAASLWPSWRATRVDPVLVLRAD
jgi:predicted permease